MKKTVRDCSRILILRLTLSLIFLTVTNVLTMTMTSILRATCLFTMCQFGRPTRLSTLPHTQSLFLVVGENIFTFHTESTSYVFDEFNDEHMRERLSEAKDVTELLMLFFLYSSQYFQRAVTQLDVERNSLDQKLSDDINNKDLVELSNIEKSLVYLSSSIQTDLIMLHGLNHSKLDFTKEASERLDDVLIESSQSAEMVQISQQVTKTLSATSNNMMNNNLNDTMQFLTVWSLVLTIPTILTGFYGMNVSLPILKNSFDWVLIIILMVVLMVWLVILMKRHHFF